MIGLLSVYVGGGGVRVNVHSHTYFASCRGLDHRAVPCVGGKHGPALLQRKPREGLCLRMALSTLANSLNLLSGLMQGR